MAPHELKLLVNGEIRTTRVEGRESLLWVLRERLGLTGTKFGCGEGACGACSVLLDGRETASCRLPATAVGEREVVTIEGLGEPGRLSPVQRAFVEHTAFGCGYCTPGMIVATTALLRENPRPTRAEIVAALNRHLCRCAVYPNILEAVAALAESSEGRDV